MNFIIGDDKRIDFSGNYSGKYFADGVNSDKTLEIYKKESCWNRVRIAQKGNAEDYGIGIYFEYNNEQIEDILWYSDNISKINNVVGFSSNYNIFDKYRGEVIRRLDKEPRRNIGGLLSFNLNVQDNFIAKVLMSIVIYKKKVGKFNLDNEDYHYIFYELFKEDVDISEIVDKEIPKTLVRGK